MGTDTRPRIMVAVQRAWFPGVAGIFRLKSGFSPWVSALKARGFRGLCKNHVIFFGRNCVTITFALVANGDFGETPKLLAQCHDPRDAGATRSVLSRDSGKLSQRKWLISRQGGDFSGNRGFLTTDDTYGKTGRKWRIEDGKNSHPWSYDHGHKRSVDEDDDGSKYA